MKREKKLERAQMDEKEKRVEMRKGRKLRQEGHKRGKGREMRV